MENASKKTVTKPPAERQPMCDGDILRLLADQRDRTVAELVTHFHVTQTTIRFRLNRLMFVQSVTRKRNDEHRGQGRRGDLYFITSQGTAALAKAAE